MGVFLLGIFLPFTHSKGAIAGLLSSLAVSSWISLGAYSSGKALPEPLPTSITGCPANVTSLLAFNSTSLLALNSTTPAVPMLLEEKGFLENYVYSISYTLYSPIGCFVCLLVGTVISLLVTDDNQEVDESLVNPMSYKLYKRMSAASRSAEPAACKKGQDNGAFTMSTYKQTMED